MYVQCKDKGLLNLSRFDEVTTGLCTDGGWSVLALRRRMGNKGRVCLQSRTISTHRSQDEAELVLEVLTELLSMDAECIRWDDIVDNCDALEEKKRQKEAARVG